jgi:hypothetical protein
MSASLKQVADNLYYLKLDKIENCTLCGKQLLEYIAQLKIPIESRLILNIGENKCFKVCNAEFLDGMTQFKSIAYVVKEETATYDPWTHAMLVHKKNTNTQYCDSFDEAYEWSIFQDKKNA